MSETSRYPQRSGTNPRAKAGFYGTLKATIRVQTTAEITDADKNAMIVRFLFAASEIIELARGAVARLEGSRIGDLVVRGSAKARERVGLGLSNCRFDLTVCMERAMSCSCRAPHPTNREAQSNSSDHSFHSVHVSCLTCSNRLVTGVLEAFHAAFTSPREGFPPIFQRALP